MRTFYVIEPEGWPCSLEKCPAGFFIFKGFLGFKSEYLTDNKHVEAFCESGEYFWGGTDTQEARLALIVQPVVMRETEMEA